MDALHCLLQVAKPVSAKVQCLAMKCAVMLITWIGVAVDIDDQSRVLRASTDPPWRRYAIVQCAGGCLFACDRPNQCRQRHEHAHRRHHGVHTHWSAGEVQ